MSAVFIVGWSQAHRLFAKLNGGGDRPSSARRLAGLLERRGDLRIGPVC